MIAGVRAAESRGFYLGLVGYFIDHMPYSATALTLVTIAVALVMILHRMLWPLYWTAVRSHFP